MARALQALNRFAASNWPASTRNFAEAVLDHDTRLSPCHLLRSRGGCNRRLQGCGRGGCRRADDVRHRAGRNDGRRRRNTGTASAGRPSDAGPSRPFAHRHARRRAQVVLPTPRGPENRNAWASCPSDIAFLSVLETCDCPTTESKVEGRYFLAETTNPSTDAKLIKEFEECRRDGRGNAQMVDAWCGAAMRV